MRNNAFIRCKSKWGVTELFPIYDSCSSFYIFQTDTGLLKNPFYRLSDLNFMTVQSVRGN